ncbi:MAG TPA: VWA domain-containing protein [Chloroflexia bacterium]|nr:VWA domain-containing protein [Chloroflexia bacterium]
MANEVALQCRLNVQEVPAAGEPRLIYLLLDVQPAATLGTRAAPVNLGIVLDISESMRLPVLSQEQFQELARLGHTKEVIADGIPVWTFPHIPDHIRRAAPSNLDAVKQALREAVGHVEPEDRFSLVVFAGRAEVLLHSLTGAERNRIPETIERLDAVRLGDETDMATGIQAGLRELEAGAAAGLISRMVVLTDGFTRNPEGVATLARQAKAAGIAVSTVGVGSEFNERLLVAMADESQGNAYLAREPRDIPPAFAKELAAVQSITVRHLVASVRLSAGVELRRAHRLRPAISTLRDVPIQDRTLTFDLGDLETERPPAMLLELIVPSRAAGSFRIATITLAYDVPGPTGTTGAQAHADAVINFGSRGMGALDPQVMNIVEKVSAFQLQTRALDDAAMGNVQGATTKLRSAATRLLQLGETDLAQAAEQEAQKLEQSGQVSADGAKKLQYETRRLTQRLDL